MEAFINKLTGEPVSQAMQDVLKRLTNNENVLIEEIKQLKEIKEAYSCLSGNAATANYANRDGIQNGVLKSLNSMGSAVISNGSVTYSGEIKCEKRLDIVIGLPASGKSSAIVEPLSEFYKSRIVDSDEAKKRLPEYNNGWGAEIVHKESQKISQTQMDTAISCGENIIYPRVGGNVQEMKYVIADCKNKGYSVYIHYNKLSENKALGRLLQRFLDTGRFIKPELVAKYGNSIDDTYKALKNEPHLIDGYSSWDNDVPFGDKPRNIEYSASCKDFCQKAVEEYKDELSGLKQTNTKLVVKICEVNEIFRENPKLSQEYKAARDDYRSRKENKQEIKPTTIIKKSKAEVKKQKREHYNGK